MKAKKASIDTNTKSKYIGVSFSLEKELYERLDTLAKMTGRSKAFYVRIALFKYLEILEEKYKGHIVLDDDVLN